MGTIELDNYDGDPFQEHLIEKCVGEGGHFFYRTGERFQDGDFEVQCERCYAQGWEKPDAGDEAREPKVIEPGDTEDTGPRMQMAALMRSGILP